MVQLHVVREKLILPTGRTLTIITVALILVLVILCVLLAYYNAPPTRDLGLATTRGFPIVRCRVLYPQSLALTSYETVARYAADQQAQFTFTPYTNWSDVITEAISTSTMIIGGATEQEIRLWSNEAMRLYNNGTISSIPPLLSPAYSEYDQLDGVLTSHLYRYQPIDCSLVSATINSYLARHPLIPLATEQDRRDFIRKVALVTNCDYTNEKCGIVESFLIYVTNFVFGDCDAPAGYLQEVRNRSVYYASTQESMRQALNSLAQFDLILFDFSRYRVGYADDITELAMNTSFEQTVQSDREAVILNQAYNPELASAISGAAISREVSCNCASRTKSTSRQSNEPEQVSVNMGNALNLFDGVSVITYRLYATANVSSAGETPNSRLLYFGTSDIQSVTGRPRVVDAYYRLVRGVADDALLLRNNPPSAMNDIRFSETQFGWLPIQAKVYFSYRDTRFRMQSWLPEYIVPIELTQLQPVIVDPTNDSPQLIRACIGCFPGERTNTIAFAPRVVPYMQSSTVFPRTIYNGEFGIGTIISDTTESKLPYTVLGVR